MNDTPLDFSACSPETLILTPNRRLSAWLVRDHDAAMAAQGLRAWPRLNALPLDAWLQQLFDALGLLLPAEKSVPRVLTARQSALLWRQVIEQDQDPLPDVEGLVQLAQQARALICRWRIEAGQLDSGLTPENARFAQWHRLYLARLQQDNLLDQPALLQWVLAQGDAVRPMFPATIFLHGFNDHSEPQLRHLMTCAQQAGSRIGFSHLPSRNGTCHSVAFAQVDEQFGAAVNWALTQRAASVQPVRIGIVIPNLQNQRARMRAICQALWQQQPDHGQHHWTDIINITAGQKLTDYPLVSHLLLLLRALGGELSLLEWNLLLTSPCFAGDTAFIEHDRFSQRLRDQNCMRLGLDAVARRWQQFAPGGSATADWLARLQSARSSAKKQSIPQWLNWLNGLLVASQWGQQRTLSSEEFQIRQRLQETLLTLLELTPFVTRLSLTEFCHELNESLRGVQFQPQTETACIQIMGVLEAAGLPFDALWVCECEAANWPQSVSANPLLPRQIQRALNMPGATPERELHYSAALLDGFRNSAPQVVFSWGEHQGDTGHALASLLLDIPVLDTHWPDAFRFHSLEQRQYQEWRDTVLQLPPDEYGAPVEEQHARGGSGIIKSQSQCPFKAFAEYRLNIRAQDELTEGVRAADRGHLLHRVLEKFWLEVKDSAGLQLLIEDESRLDVLLHDIVDAEIRQLRAEVILEPAALYPLEQARTFSLVKRWLKDYDARRDPFNIEQVEKKRTLLLNGIELSLAVDRIDRIGDALAIIDYKSGDKEAQVLQGERPEEPQLLLYAMLEPEKTRGLYFGVLHNSRMQYKGMQDAQLAFGKGTGKIIQANDWAAQMQEWQQTLAGLAQEYREGRAVVEPVNPKVCQYCHLGPVCRIRESAQELADDIG